VHSTEFGARFEIPTRKMGREKSKMADVHRFLSKSYFLGQPMLKILFFSKFQKYSEYSKNFKI
jgi:hypothetical protein